MTSSKIKGTACSILYLQVNHCLLYYTVVMVYGSSTLGYNYHNMLFLQLKNIYKDPMNNLLTI